jgi:hypothetical protein
MPVDREGIGIGMSFWLETRRAISSARISARWAGRSIASARRLDSQFA